MEWVDGIQFTHSRWDKVAGVAPRALGYLKMGWCIGASWWIFTRTARVFGKTSFPDKAINTYAYIYIYLCVCVIIVTICVWLPLHLVLISFSGMLHLKLCLQCHPHPRTFMTPKLWSMPSENRAHTGRPAHGTVCTEG
jgi:hypothetical protein